MLQLIQPVEEIHPLNRLYQVTLIQIHSHVLPQQGHQQTYYFYQVLHWPEQLHVQLHQ